MQSENPHSNQRPKSPPLFPMGQIVATKGAIFEMAAHSVLASDLLKRHVTGDWAELDEQDRHENRFALRAGLRIFSSYKLDEEINIWIITEADRSVTTILLPEEY